MWVPPGVGVTVMRHSVLSTNRQVGTVIQAIARPGTISVTSLVRDHRHQKALLPPRNEDLARPRSHRRANARCGTRGSTRPCGWHRRRSATRRRRMRAPPPLPDTFWPVVSPCPCCSALPTLPAGDQPVDHVGRPGLVLIREIDAGRLEQSPPVKRAEEPVARRP